MPRRDPIRWSCLAGLLALGCPSRAPSSEPAPSPAPRPGVETPDQIREALTESVKELAAHRAAFEAAGFDQRLEVCEALGERIGELWAATRRAAILEAKRRAVPRPTERVEPVSRREEDDLLVNFTTQGYAELAALSYQLRWGGWREAGSEAVLTHLLTTTGIGMVAVQASCDPDALQLTASAECHAKVALAASLLGIERCP